MKQILRTFITCLLLLSTFVAVEAQTNVSGTINANTTWTTAGSPYIVTNTLTLSAGAVLNISPGVVVKFSSYYSGIVLVNGTLNAIGNSANPIVITSLKDDTYGGDSNNDGTATNPAAGNWDRIFISTEGSNSVLNHCIFRYGGASNNVVNTSNSSPTITNCVFENNGNSALGLSGTSAPTITNNHFANNQYAPIA